MVQSDRGQDVLRPADAHRLVVVAEHAPGDRDVRGVLPDIHRPVAQTHELAVVDPDMVRGVHADAVVVVVVALPVPVPRHIGITEGEVADHDVRDTVEVESSAHDLRASAHAEDAGVRGDLEGGPERLDGDRPLHEHDRRPVPEHRLGERLCILDHDDVTAETSDRSVRSVRSAHAGEARGLRGPDGAILRSSARRDTHRRQDLAPRARGGRRGGRRSEGDERRRGGDSQGGGELAARHGRHDHPRSVVANCVGGSVVSPSRSR